MIIKHFAMAALKIGLLGFCMASILCALPANAAPLANNYPSVIVKYGDLDLSTEAGARRLLRRIVSAAERVCPSTAELQTLVAARACKADTIARTVRAVNNPQLATLHERSTTHG